MLCLIYCTQEQWIPNESLIQGVEQIFSNIDVGVTIFAIECILILRWIVNSLESEFNIFVAHHN